jgi:hypothetical protein
VLNGIALANNDDEVDNCVVDVPEDGGGRGGGDEDDEKASDVDVAKEGSTSVVVEEEDDEDEEAEAGEIGVETAIERRNRSSKLIAFSSSPATSCANPIFHEGSFSLSSDESIFSRKFFNYSGILYPFLLTNTEKIHIYNSKFRIGGERRCYEYFNFDSKIYLNVLS